MWVLEKIRERIPLALSRHMGKSEEDIFLSSKASLSHNLHNILTPDKIPEFCLPPRLCKRSTLQERDTVAPHLNCWNKELKRNTLSKNPEETAEDGTTKNGEALVARRVTKKPLPFSAEGYGLAGIYESPNTRRKESLFHSERPVYIFDKNIPTAAPRLAKDTNIPKKSLTGFLLPFLNESLSKTGGAESESSSLSESSPLCSPYIPSGRGRLRAAASCPEFIDSGEKTGRRARGGLYLTTSPCCLPSLERGSLTIAPPVLFPMDGLQCQKRLRREHFLPLQARGEVHLFVEQTTSSSGRFSSLFTVKVRVVSVEGVWDDADQQTLTCAVNLCLTPGVLQQQESATIRNCRQPVFNEDFFFTELNREDLQELMLRLRVVNKPAVRTLRRGTVLGTVTRPLSMLLTIKK